MPNTDLLKKLAYKKAEAKGLVLDPLFKAPLDLELSIIDVHECADYFLLYSRIMDICSRHKSPRPKNQRSCFLPTLQENRENERNRKEIN
jgi:hypothetical protein